MPRWPEPRKPLDVGADGKKVMKVAQAARMVDKNARTIAKIMHILVRF
jgi:hypothetical protein